MVPVFTGKTPVSTVIEPVYSVPVLVPTFPVFRYRYFWYGTGTVLIPNHPPTNPNTTSSHS
ncbi:hypothetical protein Hanom_Chr11g01038871 [Helianthus anomalus]